LITFHSASSSGAFFDKICSGTPILPMSCSSAPISIASSSSPFRPSCLASSTATAATRSMWGSTGGECEVCAVEDRFVELAAAPKPLDDSGQQRDRHRRPRVQDEAAASTPIADTLTLPRP
jgi:hypothetical protein